MPPKKKGGRNKRRGRKSIASIAKSVALAVIKKQADATYCTQLFGSYNSNGSINTVLPVNPGHTHGYVIEFPQIELADDIEKLGDPGYRKDEIVTLNGIKFRLRFRLPSNVDYANLSVYLAKVNTAGVTSVAYSTPDFQCILRNSLGEPMLIKRKILWSKTFKMAHSSLQGVDDKTMYVSRDIEYYHKFDTPFKLKFAGTDGDAWLSNRFQFVVKADYDPEVTGSIPASKLVSLVGSVVTYYRDL